MSSPPGGTIPLWWRSCPWRATQRLPRAATKRGIFQSSLSLCLLVNAPMLHRACSIIIVNPNIKVKFQTNEHLKKVFSEQFELFWTKSRQVGLKHQLPSTFIKFMVTIKNYQNTKSNEKSLRQPVPKDLERAATWSYFLTFMQSRNRGCIFLFYNTSMVYLCATPTVYRWYNKYIKNRGTQNPETLNELKGDY